MPSAPQFSPRARDIAATSFATLNRYWNDRVYRQQCAIEADHQNALNNAAMDRRLITTNNRFPAHWTPQEKHDAAVRWIEGKA